MLRRRSVEAEIERVYRERFRAFVVVATAILDDPHAAYDTVQDAFARAIERRSSFRREGTVEASGAPYVGVIVTPGELG
jgi:DNA-directed RNA polymerase specialized sigma24 family protein